ncbi:Ribosomal protein 63, mitochondrial [Branchiostoma belcheri]|nr:Ribosomal protein 63, mitochondrial [Branchiostoma belcheri]
MAKRKPQGLLGERPDSNIRAQFGSRNKLEEVRGEGTSTEELQKSRKDEVVDGFILPPEDSEGNEIQMVLQYRARARQTVDWKAPSLATNHVDDEEEHVEKTAVGSRDREVSVHMSLVTGEQRKEQAEEACIDEESRASKEFEKIRDWNYRKRMPAHKYIQDQLEHLNIHKRWADPQEYQRDIPVRKKKSYLDFK